MTTAVSSTSIHHHLPAAGHLYQREQAALPSLTVPTVAGCTTLRCSGVSKSTGQRCKRRVRASDGRRDEGETKEFCHSHRSQQTDSLLDPTIQSESMTVSLVSPEIKGQRYMNTTTTRLPLDQAKQHTSTARASTTWTSVQCSGVSKSTGKRCKRRVRVDIGYLISKRKNKDYVKKYFCQDHRVEVRGSEKQGNTASVRQRTTTAEHNSKAIKKKDTAKGPEKSEPGGLFLRLVKPLLSLCSTARGKPTLQQNTTAKFQASDRHKAGLHDPRKTGTYTTRHAHGLAGGSASAPQGIIGGAVISMVSTEMRQKYISLLATEVLKPVSLADEAGYIYIYELEQPGVDRRSMHPDTLLYLKIGRAKDVARRMQQWTTQCSHEVILTGHFPAPPPSRHDSAAAEIADDNARTQPPATRIRCRAIHRAERLIHLELRSLFPCSADSPAVLLRIAAASATHGHSHGSVDAADAAEDTCSACGKRHTEWFAVRKKDAQIAVRIVAKWVEFVGVVEGA
ncbi:uncharacterized protein V1518DRAFT_409729 [Limtongia smithiae]|uniref:uncharacterized protein n=1 Tax=Limtongia smithiae TaxID=1125753 RepID=UPI0034CF302B